MRSRVHPRLHGKDNNDDDDDDDDDEDADDEEDDRKVQNIIKEGVRSRRSIMIESTEG